MKKKTGQCRRSTITRCCRLESQLNGTSRCQFTAKPTTAAAAAAAAAGTPSSQAPHHPHHPPCDAGRRLEPQRASVRRAELACQPVAAATGRTPSSIFLSARCWYRRATGRHLDAYNCRVTSEHFSTSISVGRTCRPLQRQLIVR